MVSLMKILGSSMRWAIASAIVLAASALHAQPPVRLPDTVVTATRVVQPLSDLVADVSTFERADIERLGITSLTELLARLPGLQTVSSGDSQRVFIRGADARMTALYIDGVRVDSQDGLTLGGGAPWDLVPLAQIERIEVLRGPASAVYGSDAMGGVVQVFTRQGTGTPGHFAELGAGSFNAQKARFGLRGASGGWHYALSLGREQSDGFNTRPDLAHTPDKESSNQRSTSLRLGYDISLAHQVQLTALDTQRDSRYVPWGGGADIPASGHLSALALKWAGRWSDDYRTQVSIARSAVAKSDAAPNDYKTSTQSALWENHLRAFSGDLTAVLEQKRDAFVALPTTWDPRIEGDRTQNALALGYGVSMGPHAVQLNARSDRDSVFGSHQTGSAAYAYALSQRWRASLSTGSAFRAPTLEQVFGPYGSQQLKPETNQSHEMSLRYQDAVSDLRLVVYRNEIRDMISSSATLDTCAAGFFCYYNVGKASIQGSTLSARHQWGAFALQGSFDFLDPRDDVTGKVLSLRARRSMALGFDTHTGAWQWGADWRAVGERFDNAANTRTLGAYELLGLHASTALGRDWKLVARIDNATDQSYQEVGDYATPGRTFFVALQWNQR